MDKFGGREERGCREMYAVQLRLQQGIQRGGGGRAEESMYKAVGQLSTETADRRAGKQRVPEL